MKLTLLQLAVVHAPATHTENSLSFLSLESLCKKLLDLHFQLFDVLCVAAVAGLISTNREDIEYVVVFAPSVFLLRLVERSNERPKFFCNLLRRPLPVPRASRNEQLRKLCGLLQEYQRVPVVALIDPRSQKDSA